MKSFYEQFKDRDMTNGTVVLDEATYKQIQLDAYKAGMTAAAEIALSEGDGVGYCPVGSDAILVARDKLIEI